MARIALPIQKKIPFMSIVDKHDGMELHSKSLIPDAVLEDGPHVDVASIHTDTTNISGTTSIIKNELYELHRLFRPVTFVMGCFGVYHPSRYVVSGKATKRDFRQTHLVRYLTIAVALLNFVFLFSNFITFIVAHPVVNMGLISATMYVILLVWLACGSMQILLHFIIFEEGQVDRIWAMWAEWAEKYPYARSWSGMRLFRNVCLGIASFCTIVPTVVVAVGSANTVPGTWLEEMFRPIEYGGLRVNHLWLTIDFTVIVFLVYGVASFTAVFFVVNCLVLTKELQNLHYVIADRLGYGKMWDDVKTVNEAISEIEQLRRRRLHARKIVEEMNTTFKLVSFLSLLANVPLIVFVVYGLVLHGDKSQFMMIFGVIVTLLALAQVGFVCVAAARINQWADAPRGLLHTIRIDDSLPMSLTNSASLSLFLSELNSESIGITAAGLALITKQFIATVVGVAVTYIIVLLQFNAASSMLSMTHDITSTLNNMTVDLNRTKNMVSDSAAEAFKDARY